VGDDLAADLRRVLSSQWLDGNSSSCDPYKEYGLRDLFERCLKRMNDEAPIRMLAPVKLGECLRCLRELKRLTMGDLSRALGVSVSQISNWELGREPMPELEQRKYVSALFDAPEVLNARVIATSSTRVQELLENNTALVNELRRVDRQRQVREFHAAVVGEPLPEHPCVPSEAILRRQARLITEEYLEAMEAIYTGGNLVAEGVNLYTVQETLNAIVDQAPLSVKLPELIDATVDLDYVVEGLRAWCGIDSQGVWAVVQAANMAKAGGPKRKSDNKQLKPPGWKPPDIAAEIERQKAAALARERGPK
jgi:predicted HAD superfamily Cof-like phosphohydrolase/DNA-binding transcriptional regulator YiaG